MDESSSFPSEFQRRTLWRAVTGVAIMVLGALLVGLIWLTSSVLGYLQPVLVPLAVAGIIAYLLDPVVQWLQKKSFARIGKVLLLDPVARWFRKKRFTRIANLLDPIERWFQKKTLSRITGIIAVFLGFLLFFGILLFFVGSKLSKQIQGALARDNSSSISDAFTAEKIDNYKSGSLGWIAKLSFQKDQDATHDHLQNGGAIVGSDKSRWRLAEDGVTLQANGEKPSVELSNFLRSDWTDDVTIDGKENASNIIVSENFSLTKVGHMLTGIGGRGLAWLLDSSGKILGFFGVILGLAMVPIYLYYFLKESDGIKNSWEDYVPLKASKFKTSVVDTLKEINGYLISFFRGQVLVAFIDGILVGLALTVFGLDYGLLIGVCMALLGIIPYIGNIICLIPACFIAANQDSSTLWNLPQWGAVLAVVLIFVVVQQINSLVTAPKIVGDSVGLHPMTVIFSMLFWSLLLGGLLGALLAVPLTAAVKVVFRRYLWDRRNPENDALRFSESGTGPA